MDPDRNLDICEITLYRLKITLHDKSNNTFFYFINFEIENSHWTFLLFLVINLHFIRGKNNFNEKPVSGTAFTWNAAATREHAHGTCFLLVATSASFMFLQQNILFEPLLWIRIRPNPHTTKMLDKNPKKCMWICNTDYINIYLDKVHPHSPHLPALWPHPRRQWTLRCRRWRTHPQATVLASFWLQNICSFMFQPVMQIRIHRIRIKP